MPARDSPRTPTGTGAAAAEAALRTTVAVIAEDADAIARTVAALVHREVPEAAVDPVTVEETRRTSRATLLALVDGWRRGEPPAQVQPPPELLFQVGVMVRDGIPLGPLLQILQLAHGALADAWDERITTAGLSPALQARTMRLAHQLTFAWFAGLTAQLTAAYAREHARAARTPDAKRREAVLAALSGRSVDVDALSRTAAHEFRRHHVGLVLWHGAPAGGDVPAALDVPRPLVLAAREVALRLGAPPPLLVPAASAVAWGWVALPAAPAADALRAAVDAARPADTWIASGDPAPGLDGFRATHADALAAAQVAMLGAGTAAPDGGGTARYDDVELVALLADDLPRARRFALRRLGDLARDDPDHAVLRATLLVYLEEHGSRTATASRVGVHPNTVTNRARAAEALIGRPLTERPVELQVALALAASLGPQVLLAESAGARTRRRS
ncbi:hypothetical protein DSM112329_00993 [Paraconexibacter sp. AEG42_29]|uniref:PucR family transcriptional regulator n=1 Tax=Paraconexibacter sp. AEG42_29 TaxID=2997339 RepID=A0AAU7AS23_9ACTN